MAKIEFKGKVKKMEYADGTFAYEYISVPMLDRKHCDMQEFRIHSKYGVVANSDLFKSVLNGIRKEKFPNGKLYLNKIPSGVTVDTSGFLAVVSIDV